MCFKWVEVGRDRHVEQASHGFILIEWIKSLKQREGGETPLFHIQFQILFLISFARARFEDESVSCILTLLNLSIAMDDS